LSGLRNSSPRRFGLGIHMRRSDGGSVDRPVRYGYRLGSVAVSVLPLGRMQNCLSNGPGH